MLTDDPEYPRRSYRLFLFLLALVTAVLAVRSAWQHEWAGLWYWALGLGVFVLALCGYAGVIWLLAQVVLGLRRLWKKTRQGRPGKKT